MKLPLLLLLVCTVATGCVQPWHARRAPAPAVRAHDAHDQYAWLYWQEQAVVAGAAEPVDRPPDHFEAALRITEAPVPPAPSRLPSPPTHAEQEGLSDLSRSLDQVMRDLDRLVDESITVQQALLRLRLRAESEPEN